MLVVFLPGAPLKVSSSATSNGSYNLMNVNVFTGRVGSSFVSQFNGTAGLALSTTTNITTATNYYGITSGLAAVNYVFGVGSTINSVI